MSDMKKRTLKKRAHKLFNSFSLSSDDGFIAIGKPIYGREIKALVYAANRLCPIEGFNDILRYATFNPHKKYVLDLNVGKDRGISIIRYSDSGPDRLGYTYLELLEFERTGHYLYRL